MQVFLGKSERVVNMSCSNSGLSPVKFMVWMGMNGLKTMNYRPPGGFSDWLAYMKPSNPLLCCKLLQWISGFRLYPPVIKRSRWKSTWKLWFQSENHLSIVYFPARHVWFSIINHLSRLLPPLFQWIHGFRFYSTCHYSNHSIVWHGDVSFNSLSV